jgi:tetratricopeptide (TPR) repeat protein
LLHRQEWRIALEEFGHVLEIEPSNYRAYVGISEALIELGCFRQAESRLQQAVELEPKRPRPYYLLARVYEKLGESGKAQDFYGKVLKLAPGYPGVHRSIEESEE